MSEMYSPELGEYRAVSTGVSNGWYEYISTGIPHHMGKGKMLFDKSGRIIPAVAEGASFEMSQRKPPYERRADDPRIDAIHDRIASIEATVTGLSADVTEMKLEAEVRSRIMSKVVFWSRFIGIGVLLLLASKHPWISHLIGEL